MAEILYPAGNKKPVTPANGQNFQLAELRAIVGGSIEIVACADPRFILVCNEESKLRGLPRNEQASALVPFATVGQMKALMRKKPRDIFIGFDFTGMDDDAPADYIAGTVLYCRSSEVR